MPTIVVSINSSWNILNFRMGLIRALQDAGYRVVVLTPPDAGSVELRRLGLDHVAVPIDSAGLSPRADGRLLLAYWRVLRRLRPAAFLGWTIKPNIWGSLAAHQLRIPVINNIAGLGTAFLGRNWLRRLASSLYRLALRRSAVVFFQNRDDLNLFAQGGLIDVTTARLLPGSGINLDHFPLVGMPVGDRYTFLLIARVLRDKGVYEYAEAARMLRAAYPRARFQLLGPLDAVNRTAIPRSVIDGWVGEGVIDYLGEAEDVRPYLAGADCIVLPSYREGLPRTLLEGAATGRPLIATDVAGCRDVVENGVNGFTCADRDPGSLAAAMAAMLRLSPAERASFGQAARAMVEDRFQEQVVIDRYLDALDEVVRRRRDDVPGEPAAAVAHKTARQP